MFRRVIAAIMAAALLVATVGCASRPHVIPAASVSTAEYEGLDCKAVAMERIKVEGDLEQLSIAQNSAASSDTAIFWVGLLLLWPVWFGWAATDDFRDEIARLKGEKRALDTVFASRCSDNEPEPAAVGM